VSLNVGAAVSSLDERDGMGELEMEMHSNAISGRFQGAGARETVWRKGGRQGVACKLLAALDDVRNSGVDRPLDSSAGQGSLTEAERDRVFNQQGGEVAHRHEAASAWPPQSLPPSSTPPPPPCRTVSLEGKKTAS
jgi:hypothetical protein